MSTREERGEGQNPQKPVNVFYGIPTRSNFSLSNRTHVVHGCSHCESYCFGENGGHYNDNPIFFLKSREMRLRDQKKSDFWIPIDSFGPYRKWI